jgi:hypothetical protein
MSPLRWSVGFIAVGFALASPSPTLAQRQMEALGRGVVATPLGNGKVFVGWRLLGTDPDDIAFNLYRSKAGGLPAKLNAEPISGATSRVDDSAESNADLAYFVRPVVGGVEGEPSLADRIANGISARPFRSIPLQTLPEHMPNDASVGDLDGDGEYEIVLKQVMRERDNSQAGTTGETKLEAYTLGGRFLWRINLGKNIREGAHYTQFLVYDFDGDGRAEVACKTADGTVDGVGTTIGDPSADHRNPKGFILDGPEFLTIFEGATGKALATTAYTPPRGGNGSAWGDDRGNRVDRFGATTRGRSSPPGTGGTASSRTSGPSTPTTACPASQPIGARGTTTSGLATSTATARTRSSTGPPRSTTTAKDSTRPASVTVTPSTCPTSTPTARVSRSSTSTNGRSILTALSFATPGLVP